MKTILITLLFFFGFIALVFTANIEAVSHQPDTHILSCRIEHGFIRVPTNMVKQGYFLEMVQSREYIQAHYFWWEGNTLVSVFNSDTTYTQGTCYCLSEEQEKKYFRKNNRPVTTELIPLHFRREFLRSLFLIPL